jgi:ATP-dependent DNA helicase DinG
LLPTLELRLSAREDLLSAASLDLVRARLAPAAHAAREKGQMVFNLLDAVLEESGTSMYRLTSDFEAHPIWRAGLTGALEDLLGEIALIGDGLRVVRDRLDSDGKTSESLAPVLNEIRGVTRRLEAAGDALRSALAPPEESAPAVRWLERRGKEKNVAATAVPLDLAPILREDLFRRLETTIVTSATLSTDGRFDFLKGRLGLVEADVEPEVAAHGSPFDFARQAIIAVPTDVPAPNVDGPGHSDASGRLLMDLIEAANGGVFALYTSHRDVRDAAFALRRRGIDRRWPLLVHGEDSRDALLRRFRDSGCAVLVGTASFWEGVDVPGQALRGLLISKLPFKVPTEPLTAAHCEAINMRGGDAFQEYMIPHAALRLKQGFGRLIRSATDQGVVVLGDVRVLRKSYGAALLDSLPPARRLSGSWSELREEIREFYR